MKQLILDPSVDPTPPGAGLAGHHEDLADLSIEQLQALCDEYFALLDSTIPPLFICTDYERACEELEQRLENNHLKGNDQ